MGRPIKILVNAFPMVNINTGIGRYLRCLYQALEEHYGERLEIGYFDGKHVSAVMPTGPQDLNRWTRLVSLFWRLPSYPALMVRLLFHANQERHFRKVAGDFDLYHEAAFFPLRTPKHVKTVFTLTDLSLFRFPEHHPKERVLYAKLFFRKRVRRVDRFLTISSFIAKEMETYLNIHQQDIAVTHLAYDPAILYPRPPAEIGNCLLRHGIPDAYFLFVGSGDPRKNMAVIPKALDRKGLKVPLVVAGWSGWAGKSSRKKVRLLGYVDDDDLARLYSGARALIFPSRYEGFGLPLLEAMACGCPVVTTREASMPEVAGEAAVYMKSPDDVSGLAEILKDLAENPAFRENWRNRGLARAARFSWRKTAEATRRAFEQTLEGADGRAVYADGFCRSKDQPESGRPIRVAVGSQFLDVKVGGAEKYIHEVCGRLERRHGMTLSYITSDGLGIPSLSAATLRFRSSGFHYGWREEIRDALRKTRPHVVYVHHTVPWISDVLLRVASELDIPTVMMYHSDVSGPEYTKRILGFFYHQLVARRSFDLCEVFLVPSMAFASHSPFLAGIKKKFLAAPPGVDPLMSKGKHDAGRSYLLFVGKPHLKSKGLDLLVKAFKDLRLRRPELELIVIGRIGKGYRKSEEKGVKYVGYVNSRRALADWYASAAVTVLPSTIPGESFGMVMAEALVAGCPVVGPRLGGVPEMIQEGMNGYMFSPGDARDLKAAILRTIRDGKKLRNHIVQRQDLYQERYNWDRTAEIVAGTLRSVALKTP